MGYKRKEIDAGIFSGLLPEGVKLFQQPELPKRTWKKGTAKYTITDIRLLHPVGVYIIEELLKTMCLTGKREMTFKIEEGFTEEALDIATDIAMGFCWDAKYRGGAFIGGKLVGCVTRGETEDGQKTITFKADPDDAQAAYEYFSEKDDENISLQELIIALCDASNNRFEEVNQ